MLALALLPAVSHALAASRANASLTEICTSQGMRPVALGDAGSSEGAPASGSGHLEHCPYCASSLGALGMPPAAITLRPVPLAAELPPRLLDAPRASAAWRGTQARAPPSLPW